MILFSIFIRIVPNKARDSLSKMSPYNMRSSLYLKKIGFLLLCTYRNSCNNIDYTTVYNIVRAIKCIQIRILACAILCFTARPCYDVE